MTDGPAITIAISGFLPQDEPAGVWEGLPKSSCSPAYLFQWEAGDYEQFQDHINNSHGKRAGFYGGIMLMIGASPIELIVDTLLMGSFDVRQFFTKYENKAEKSGQALACAIVLNIPPFAKGKTVNLIGYGLGSRVIESCIRQLEIFNAKDMIQNVTFLVAAVSAQSGNLNELAKSFTSVSPHGVFKNVYTTKDSTLINYAMSTMRPALGRNEFKPSLRVFDCDSDHESAIETIKDCIHIQNYDIGQLGINGYFETWSEGIGNFSYEQNMQMIYNFIDLQ